MKKPWQRLICTLSLITLLLGANASSALALTAVPVTNTGITSISSSDSEDSNSRPVATYEGTVVNVDTGASELEGDELTALPEGVMEALTSTFEEDEGYEEPVYVLIKWGVLDSANAVSATEETVWDGTLSITKGKFLLSYLVAFEAAQGDGIVSMDEDEIEFVSAILNSFDGLLLQVRAEEGENPVLGLDTEYGGSIHRYLSQVEAGFYYEKDDLYAVSMKEVEVTPPEEEVTADFYLGEVGIDEDYQTRFYADICLDGATEDYTSVEYTFKAQNEFSASEEYENTLTTGHPEGCKRYYSWDFETWGIDEGKIFNLTVTVDSDNEVEEVDESNNQAISSSLLIPPVSLTCADSDFGMDYYTQGTTSGIYYYTGGSQEKTDYCDGQGNLGEFFCRDDGTMYVTYVTPSEGYVCENGVLTTEQTETEEEIDFYLDDLGIDEVQPTLFYLDVCLEGGEGENYYSTKINFNANGVDNTLSLSASADTCKRYYSWDISSHFGVEEGQTYTVTGTVDSAGEWTETDETNNTLSKELTIPEEVTIPEEEEEEEELPVYDVPYYLVLKWGVLYGEERDEVAGGTNWSGYVEVADGVLSLNNTLRFESSDYVTSLTDNQLEFSSYIGPHYDGLVLVVLPEEGKDPTLTFQTAYAGTFVKTLSELLAEPYLYDAGAAYYVFMGAYPPSEIPSPYFLKKPVRFMIKWGDVEGGGTAAEVDYEGSFKLSTDEVKGEAVWTIAFEDPEDQVTSLETEDWTEVTWTSKIVSQWDGLIIEVKPNLDTWDEFDPSEQHYFTLTLNDWSQDFGADGDLGTFKLGDGNEVLIKALPHFREKPGEEEAEEEAEEEEGGSTTAGADSSSVLNKITTAYAAVAEIEDDLPDYLVADFNDLLGQYLDYDWTSGPDWPEPIPNQVVTELNSLIKSLKRTTTQAGFLKVLNVALAKFEDLKEEAKEAKYESGNIPFLDVDNSSEVWYYEYVNSVKKAGIINGYKDSKGKLTGYFGPENSVTVAEILKIALEGAGKGKSSGTPSLVIAHGHWAEGYVKRAEELGLNLVEGLDSLDRPATRGEVVKVILQALGINPGGYSKSSFTDGASAGESLASVEYLKDMGVLEGYSDGSFGYNKSVNRAETAKIADKILEIF